MLLQQLGSGGMGTVFAAYDPELDRKVDLKILHQHQTPDASSRKQAMREARALARLVHPRAVSVYDVGEADERTYLAMEFVEGQTPRTWQSQGQHSWRAILHMYLQAGEALQAAHQASVIHRDFKPDHALVQARDGLPKVVDFGLARLHDGTVDADSQREAGQAPHAADPVADSAPPTQESQVPGTRGYMSPEQQRRGQITAASDQYSFCVSFWEALYGQLPTIGAIADGPRFAEGPSTSTSIAPPGPQPARATIDVPPGALRSILQRGMSSDPQLRFGSMHTLLAELWRQHDAQASARRSRRFITVLLPNLMLTSGLAFHDGLIYRVPLPPLGSSVSVVSQAALCPTRSGCRADHRIHRRASPSHVRLTSGRATAGPVSICACPARAAPASPPPLLTVLHERVFILRGRPPGR